MPADIETLRDAVVVSALDVARLRAAEKLLGPGVLPSRMPGAVETAEDGLDDAVVALADALREENPDAGEEGEHDGDVAGSLEREAAAGG